MPRAKPVVVLSILGTVLDKASFKKRWDRWRPTVDLCRHEDLLVSRLELLHDPSSEYLAKTVIDDIATVSPETTVRPHGVGFENPWDFEEVYGGLLDWAKSQRFRPDKERYLVHMTTGTHVAQICWFLLTESRHVPAELLQTSPPKRGRRDGIGEYSVIDLDLSKYDRIAQRFVRETEDNLSFLKSGIGTRNPAFNRLIEQIERVALHSSAPMLITGPTGAGKSQLARRIYDLKQSRNAVSGAFVEVNCATLRGDQAMSALFGHKKGAFTGAVGERPGLLKAADGGILFLDEIGELGLDEQAMLLRALEEKRFLPVGSDREVKSEFSLIAGTNRDLFRRVAEGRFREDLLARIDLWTFELPGLADRPEDIEPNLEFELDRYADATGQRTTFNREGKRRFLAYATAEARWPGNFRDFNAAVTRMCTLAPGGRIDARTVEEELERLRTKDTKSAVGPEAKAQASLLDRHLEPAAIAGLDRFDRVQLDEVVRVCKAAPTLSEAGRRLFSESRKKKQNPNDADRLRKYLARFDLSFAEIREG